MTSPTSAGPQGPADHAPDGAGRVRSAPAVPADGTTQQVRPRVTGSPLTGRAALLAVVLGALVLSLALPVREYVRQRSEISALQEEQASRQAQVTALESRLKQWEDPAFVATQARQRLQYVMPGEVGYVVLDPSEAPAPAREKFEAAAASDQQSWYTRLWGSVQKADTPR